MPLIKDGRLFGRTDKVERIRMLVPDTQTHGDNVISMPHTLATAQRLNGAGLWVPGWEPIMHGWAWPTVFGSPLRADQQQTAAWMTVTPRGFVLHPPRMGKTASSLAAVLHLMDTGHVRRCLVIAVISAFDDWRRHLFTMRPLAGLHLLHGKGRDALRRSARPDAKFYMINPAGLRYIKEDIKAAVDSGFFDAVIVDELTEFAVASTAQWKAADAALRNAPYLWGLTGTPGNALQMHGQLKLVLPESNTPSSFYQWQNMVARKQGPFKWVVTEAGTEIAKKAMHPSIRHRKEDVFADMTPIIEFITVGLTPAQTSAMEKLRKDNAIQFEDGVQATAVHAAALAQKLLQISAGVMLIDDTNIATFDVTPRIDALEDIIRHKAEGKTIVFCAFREVMYHLKEELAKRGITSEMMHGGVKAADRGPLVHKFTNEADPQVLILHPIVARYSLELAVADTCVFYGPCLSGAYTYEQARNRILSGRQKSRTPGIIHLQSSLIERMMHQAVVKGRDIQQSLAESFRLAIRET